VVLNGMSVPWRPLASSVAGLSGSTASAVSGGVKGVASGPELIGVQRAPPLVLLNIPRFVPIYTIAGLVGSSTTLLTRGELPVIPCLISDHVSPALVLL